MLEEQLLDEFARRIHAETNERLDELDESIPMAPDIALLEVTLAYLDEAGALDEYELCAHEDTTGRSRSRILAYSLPEEGTRLDLFTAIYLPDGTPQTLPGSEIQRLTGQAARFFDYAAKQDFERFQANEQALDVAKRIADELDRIDEVRVLVLTNGIVRDRAVNTVQVAERPVDFSVFDLERLFRAAQEEVTRDRIEVDFTKLPGGALPCLEMTPRPSEYETYLTLLPGNLIAHLYDEYGARLFEFNVRSFLQAKGKVNKGLRDTLRTEPERFLAYNNGLTATADEIEVGMLNGEMVIKRIRGLQIVNGAQTTASIHRAKKVDRISVDKVSVSVKLTRVEPSKLAEFVPLIAEYANTQNVIQVSDLSANNQFHIAVEQLSQKVWCPGEESRWFYERTRGAYQVACLRYGSTPARRRDFDRECPKHNHFTKTDLARCLMAWWRRPQTVSRGVQKNFAIFMADLPERFPPDWQPDEAFYRDVVSLVILFKSVVSVIRRLKLPSYGTQVASYLLAKLSNDHHDRFALDAIWENQVVSDELVGLFQNWAPQIHEAVISSAGRTNIGEWLKKDAAWDHIRGLSLPTPEPEPPELGSDTDDMSNDQRPAGVSAGMEASDLVDICCRYDRTVWSRVVAWAAESGKVDDFDQRVANTLAGYALGGWKRRPSEKQARRGINVLKVALASGVLVDIP